MNNNELNKVALDTVSRLVSNGGMACVSQQLSDTAKTIGNILVDGIGKGKLGTEIGEEILEVVTPDKQYLIKSVSISDSEQSTQKSAENPPPLAIISTRGSEGTNNDTTAQVTNCAKALQVCMGSGILPKETEVCSTLFMSLEVDRRETHRSVIFHQYLELLLNVDPRRMVIYTTDAILRLGLPTYLVETLLLVMQKIHPNIKVLPVKDFALPLLEVVQWNIKESESYSCITAEYGNNKNPGGKLIPIHDNDKEAMDQIRRQAPSTKSKWCAQKSLPPQIQQGIVRGAESHPNFDKLNTRQCMKHVLGTLKSRLDDTANEKPQ